MISWLSKQVESTVSQFDNSIETHYQDRAHYFKHPMDFYRGLTELWNYLPAVELIDWNKYVKDRSVMLDLAGGTGWLSAYLSRLGKIEKIYNVDTSRHFLTVMMPELVTLLGGDAGKIEPIEGFFTPLFFDDNSLDIVVVSSSLHHADSLHTVLMEIHRILKPGGMLFLLNETPFSNTRYILSMIKQSITILLNTLMRRHTPSSPAISSSGFLYDPVLGDKAYPRWYWQKAIIITKFNLLDTIDTGLRTVKMDRNGLHLVHFICEKPE